MNTFAEKLILLISTPKPLFPLIMEHEFRHFNITTMQKNILRTELTFFLTQ